MYSMVLRQLNTQQKGVQTAHAVAKYCYKHHDDANLKQWVDVDQTLIMLDGGTYQEMNEAISFLSDRGVVYEVFEEPDLNGLTTAVCFLVDERVWDTLNYPNYDKWCIITGEFSNKASYELWMDSLGGKSVVDFREFIFSKRLSC